MPTPDRLEIGPLVETACRLYTSYAEASRVRVDERTLYLSASALLIVHYPLRFGRIVLGKGCSHLRCISRRFVYSVVSDGASSPLLKCVCTDTGVALVTHETPKTGI